MVWFQCEDCGENLKKPKLPNHFRICSASKLSCIDCGQTFGQQSVQGHTQCFTEAEKYGPKGQGKTANNANAKPNKDSKQWPDIDVNVGLSKYPPWFCSLCNTKATSEQTLLLHADGKKHRAKARAFHASKQQPKQVEESALGAELKLENLLKLDNTNTSSEADNGKFPSTKKRKHDESESNGTKKMIEGDSSDEVGNGEVIQVGKTEKEETKSQSKKAKHNVSKEDPKVESGSADEEVKRKIKLRKLITSTLKSQNPNGVLKLKKLKKIVLKALQESGRTENESQLIDEIEQKINSSSRFLVDKKYVRLVDKD